MKWKIKFVFIFLVLIFIILFFKYGVEFNFGIKYPESSNCIIPQGYKSVEVHWLKILNTTQSNFCDGSLSPLYRKVKEMPLCNCKN